MDEKWLDFLLATNLQCTRDNLTPPASPQLELSLQALDGAVDPSLILRVFFLAMGPQSRIVQHAKVALNRLLFSASLRQVARLEKRVREMSISLVNIMPGQVPDVTAEGSWAAAALCTFHPSGWVRSAALESIQKHVPETALPYLLLRLADWVPEVRSQAIKVTDMTLQPGNENAWCLGWAMLSLVDRSTRAYTLDLRVKVSAFLDSPRGHTAMTQATRSRDADVRLSAYKFLLHADRPAFHTSTELLANALVDQESRISRLALDLVKSIGPARCQLPTLLAGIKNHRSAVRRWCLDIYAQSIGGEAKPEIVKALLDSAPAVRGVAQHYAREWNLNGSLSEFYRAGLASHDPARIALSIAGLGELHAHELWSEIRPYLWARHAALRRAALHVGFQFSAGDVVDWLWVALADDEPSVTNLAYALLSKLSPAELCLKRAVRLATNARKTVQSRLNATRLVKRMSKWQQPSAFLAIARGNDDTVSIAAIKALARWDHRFNHTISQPSTEEMAELTRQLNFSEPHLPGPLLKAIRFCQKPWQIIENK